MSLIDKLNLIKQYKEAIRGAIAGKGVDIPTSTPLSQYASKIEQIAISDEYEDCKAENIRRTKVINGVAGTMDEIRRIESDIDNNEFYRNQVADVAKSYYITRDSGDCDYKYSQAINPYNGKVTTSEGYCGIDCSGFVGMVLRGITYENSPFNGSTGTADLTCDPTILYDLAVSSPYAWADPYLDLQKDDSFKDIGKTGYYSVRTAAALAEYYYSGKGKVVYEYQEYATWPSEVPPDLLPGDLIFWSKSTASDAQKSRFKGISHVGIVAHNTERYYQVTGTEDKKGDTVFCTLLSDKLEEISLIIRPNYNPIVKPATTPIGINLLPTYEFFGWNNTSGSLGTSQSKTYRGVTFTLSPYGGFTTSGTCGKDNSISFYMYKNTTDEVEYITLEPGEYELSGCPAHKTETKTKWSLRVKLGNGETYQQAGDPLTFTIEEEQLAYVVFYISKEVDATGYTIKPSLKRIK